MKRKLFLAAFLMGLSILVITFFQGYWLNKVYKDEKRNLKWKLNFLLVNSMLDLHKDNFNFDSILESHRPKLFIKNRNERGIKFQRQKMIIKEVNGNKALDTIIRTDSQHIKKPPRRRNNRWQSLNEDNIDTVATRFGLPGDTIPMYQLETSISAALKKDSISLSYVLKRLPKDTASINEFINGGDKKRDSSLAGYAARKNFELIIPSPNSYLLKRIAWPIAFSAFMIFLTVFTFVFLYRSLFRQQRLTELKNDFINNVTHELKTPIATVSVAIEALKNFSATNNPERTKEYLDISGNELNRLAILVDEVLKQSMFENRDVQLKKEPVDLKQLVEQTMRSMQLQFEKAEAKVSIEPHGNNFIIFADRLHITSVVFNLLDNALKYSKSNPIISISLNETAKNVSFSVTDNGIGIPSGYTNKVFEKFFRVPHGDTHNIKGYGLGLSYVLQVAKQHGGNITVKSVEGSGSTFSATFPK